MNRDLIEKRTYSLTELVQIAIARSPFYRELYRGLDLDRPVELAQLPVVNQADFWAANTIPEPADGRGNRVLTDKLRDGIVFKSGGTTGQPKFSFYTKSEWASFTQAFGRGLAAGGLQAGERVANLFYAGDLYASFIFIQDSLTRAPVPTLLFPLGGTAKPDAIVTAVQEFGITTLAGVPTSILALADHLERARVRLPSVKRVIFGGESLYPEQRRALSRCFPGVRLSSIGYASVDAGLLGYADAGCGPEEHRSFGTEAIIEIVDEETGAPIEETGRPGRLLVTNLTRALMPIIRYPAGDRAEWREPAGARDRKFALLGRAEEGARIGPVTVYYEDLQAILTQSNGPDAAIASFLRDRLGFRGFQLVVDRVDGLDRLTVRLGTHVSPEHRPALAALESQLTEALHRERPPLRELNERDLILPLRFEWVEPAALETNARTGKLKRVIDLRFAAPGDLPRAPTPTLVPPPFRAARGPVATGSAGAPDAPGDGAASPRPVQPPPFRGETPGLARAALPPRPDREIFAEAPAAESRRR